MYESLHNTAAYCGAHGRQLVWSDPQLVVGWLLVDAVGWGAFQVVRVTRAVHGWFA